MLHAQLDQGSIFSGQHQTLWDVEEKMLHDRLLQPRSQGTSVWVGGEEFAWSSAVLHVYEGPATEAIDDFSSLLGPAAYAATGVLAEVTDRYITGPPGTPEDENSTPLGPPGTDVFIVHGANVAWREQVARFVEGILNPDHRAIVLHEQANRGQTVLEKLEANAEPARFAVVLLTGDDEGGKRGENRLQMRARQNVVLELGFFFGLLGRRNVAVLYENGVEHPSDIAGYVYIPLDETGGWKLKLAHELRDAGLDIDLNRLA
jgi:hypothetical protein